MARHHLPHSDFCLRRRRGYLHRVSVPDHLPHFLDLHFTLRLLLACYVLLLTLTVTPTVTHDGDYRFVFPRTLGTLVISHLFTSTRSLSNPNAPLQATETRSKNTSRDRSLSQSGIPQSSCPMSTPMPTPMSIMPSSPIYLSLSSQFSSSLLFSFSFSFSIPFPFPLSNLLGVNFDFIAA